MKEKVLKGSFGAFAIGILFLLLALAFAVILYMTQSKDYHIRQNRIYGSSNAPSVVVNIHGISEAIPTTKQGITVYFVNTGNEILLLETTTDNSEIKEIEANYMELPKNPALFVAEVVPSHHSEVSRFLHSMELEEEFKKSVTTSHFLSTYKMRKNVRYTQIGVGIVTVLGAFLIGLAFYRIRRNKRTYATLYELYPELHENLDLLRTNSSYYNEQLRLALYKNHLVAFFTGMEAVDMREISTLRYVLETFRYNGIPTHSRYYFEFHNLSGKKSKLYFRKRRANVDELVSPLFSLIYEQFPNVRFMR